MGGSKHPDRSGDLRDIGAFKSKELRPCSEARLIDQGADFDLLESVAAEPVSGLTPRNRDHPRTHPRVPAEGACLAPDREHRVLEDLLRKCSIVNNKENLTQDYPTVTPIQLRQGSALSGRHTPQELEVLYVRGG